MVNWLLMIQLLAIPILLLQHQLKQKLLMTLSMKNIWHLYIFSYLIIFFINLFRCCCFFKRKKKKTPRPKWLTVVKCSSEREAVTLLRATSHSNSRDSALNVPVPTITWDCITQYIKYYFVFNFEHLSFFFM